MTAAAQITKSAQKSSRAGVKKSIEQLALERGQKAEIALKNLFISAQNVRKSRSTESIPELAATILAHGLLSHLVVILEKAQGAKGKAQTYGVVAGGRRLLALQWLKEQGHLTDESPITCMVIESDAVAVSLIENSQQEAMHAADELEAFMQLVEQGLTAGQIAAKFGLTELTVQRRLALANLAPALLDLFRNNKIDQDQLMALALTPSHERQLEVWESLPSYQRSAYYIRKQLTLDETKASESIAQFVGVDAYIAAGGEMRSDLFSSADEQYLKDTPLLMQLALAKLNTQADAIKQEGWKWVDATIEFSHADRSRFGKLIAADVEPTAAQKAEIDELESRKAKLTERLDELDALEEWDEVTEEYGERTPEQEQEHDRVTAELDTVDASLENLQEALVAWTAEQMASAGVVVSIDAGVMKVWAGLVRPEDRKEAAKQAASGEQGHTSYEPAAKERAEYSAALCQNMTAHRTAAVAAALTQNPHIALVAMLHSLLMNERERWFESPIKVSFNNHLGEVSRNAASYDETQAANILEQAETLLGDHLPGDPAALFKHLSAMSVTELLEIQAVFIARSYTVASPTASRKVRGYDLAQGIESALGMDMADWWTPTATTYLSHVSKAKMQEAITEACGAEEAKTIEKMKKAEAVAATAALLDGKGWLPPTLRAYQ